MRLTFFLVAALGALINAATSLENPITPIEGSLTAGKPTTIKWTPTTAGTITLQLRSGPADQLDTGITIACK
jgi:Ser-Thr-rich glycosyl-phosphatidyl-inositol-anchored membrane family